MVTMAETDADNATGVRQTHPQLNQDVEGQSSEYNKTHPFNCQFGSLPYSQLRRLIADPLVVPPLPIVFFECGIKIDIETVDR